VVERDARLIGVHAGVWVVALVAVVTAASALSRRSPFPAPLTLPLVGLAASFVPDVPHVRLSPTLVLIGFLPPLLYSTAIRSSLTDFRRNRSAIISLSVGLVLVTTFVTAVVLWAILPVPFTVAVALGAVVAPPDAVAASAVAQRVGMPRRMVTILEGESLVNDATALVALRTAIGAISASVSVWRIGLDFFGTAAGGLAVGLLVAVAIGKIKTVIRDEITDTAVSLVTPFVAYIVADELHCSGVLAVVVAGLLLSHKAYLLQTASARIFERTNWMTIEFLLENTVFFLIGFQVREIVESAIHSGVPAGRIALVCVAVPLSVILVRPLWVFPMVYLPPAVRRLRGLPVGEARLPWAVPAGISWAGMRGVVTIAAALVLPTDTPYRPLLILAALVVVGVTLLLQGATLPVVLRRLGVRGPDAAEDALQLAIVQQKVTAAGLRRLESMSDDHVNPDVLERLYRRAHERTDAAWERLGGTDETPSRQYARLRTEMIVAERSELIRLRDSGTVANEVLRRALGAIDVEETVLYLGENLNVPERDDDLVPTHTPPPCADLAEAAVDAVPQTAAGCFECLRDGLEWVHLRLCLRCGHVGCCDSSIGKHAAGHYHETAHPVMRSFEPGEAWRWCYVHELPG
jgi:CPA1 family monovalent cation:H+ antiporter